MSLTDTLTPPQRTERSAHRLRIVRVAALVDLVLLVTLVIAAITRQRALVQVLGPLHGINYLLLLVIVSVGAIDGVWEWWFPLAVMLTGGAPGAFIGEQIIARRVLRQNTLPHHAASSEIEIISGDKETSTSDRSSSATAENALDQREGQR